MKYIIIIGLMALLLLTYLMGNLCLPIVQFTLFFHSVLLGFTVCLAWVGHGTIHRYVYLYIGILATIVAVFIPL